MVVPAGVTSIGNEAFLNNYSLSVVYFEGDAPTLGTGVFTNTPNRLALCHLSGAEGFSSSEWEGYVVKCYYPVHSHPIRSDEREQSLVFMGVAGRNTDIVRNEKRAI